MCKHPDRGTVQWVFVVFAVAVVIRASAQEQPAKKVPKGCILQGLGSDGPGDAGLRRSSGNQALDHDISSLMAHLTWRFRAYPRLYFLDDPEPNALASPDAKGDPNEFPPDQNHFGTILLGLNLLNSELRNTPLGQKNYTIMAIVAHELGHTLQFIKKSDLSVIEKELQSDFLAGWATRFMQRSGWPDIDEANVFSGFYDRVDYAFNNPVHHGAKKERLSAFLAGFKVESDDVDLAYAKADDFVRKKPRPKTEVFAKNLGVYYERVPQDDGTFGARITRAPAANSPAGAGRLESGDIILMLDSLPFHTEQDVLNHVAETTVSVIDVRTGRRTELVIQIPPQN
jgi:hypothetical protein